MVELSLPARDNPPSGQGPLTSCLTIRVLSSHRHGARHFPRPRHLASGCHPRKVPVAAMTRHQVVSGYRSLSREQTGRRLCTLQDDNKVLYETQPRLVESRALDVIDPRRSCVGPIEKRGRAQTPVADSAAGSKTLPSQASACEESTAPKGARQHRLGPKILLPCMPALRETS